MEGPGKALVVPEQVFPAGVETFPQRFADFLIICQDHAGVVQLIRGGNQPDRAGGRGDVGDVRILSLLPPGFVGGSGVTAPGDDSGDVRPKSLRQLRRCHILVFDHVVKQVCDAIGVELEDFVRQFVQSLKRE